MAQRDAVIYKICPQSMWAEAMAKGEFVGAPVDLADGFIHFSTKAQCPKTLELYFTAQADLVLVAIDVAKMEAACAAARDAGNAAAKVQWDLSKGRGEEFPHLYGIALPVSCATVVTPIVDGPNGTHEMPAL